MNWDAIGAIAETLGAVGVIASLVYLATLIRDQMEQNTPNEGAHRLATRYHPAGLEAGRVPDMVRQSAPEASPETTREKNTARGVHRS
jgi:hypothetical protein